MKSYHIVSYRILYCIVLYYITFYYILYYIILFTANSFEIISQIPYSLTCSLDMYFISNHGFNKGIIIMVVWNFYMPDAKKLLGLGAKV